MAEAKAVQQRENLRKVFLDKIEAIMRGAPPRGLFAKVPEYRYHQNDKGKFRTNLRKMNKNVFRTLLI